jgi:hypothetical protein
MAALNNSLTGHEANISIAEKIGKFHLSCRMNSDAK